jgi:cytochrome c oxidase cbb3-type subunit 3
MTQFWSWYIIALTSGTLVALTWLIFATRKGQRSDTTEQTVGHSFDGIEEYDNPLPRWWFMLFVGTLIFAVGYLVLYPGMGTWRGVLPGYDYLDSEKKTPFATEAHLPEEERKGGWTGAHQWEKEMLRADAEYGPIFRKYAAMPIEEVAKDEQALKMGGRLFASNCSVCHATNGKGSYGFPNLTDNDWLWGGEPETIKKTIMEGRQAGMPAHNELLSTGEIRNVVGYVRSLSGLADEKKDPKQLDVAAGQDIFAARCAVCHGAEAKGNPMLGAPNLTDKIWLYGFEFADIEQTIRYGRNGKMPAQQELLGNDKVHLLAAYVYSLSQKAAEE